MTVYNRIIQIRLSAEQKAKIKSRMEAEGYKNLSAWLRKKLLTNSLWIENKINDIHKYIMERKRKEDKGRTNGKEGMRIAS